MRIKSVECGCGAALLAAFLLAAAGCEGLGTAFSSLFEPNVPVSTDPNDPNGDTDRDGLINSRETEFGTDPADPDSDNDELEDGPEVDEHGTDPLNADTDGDGLSDGEEVALGSDPTSDDPTGTVLEIPCDTILLVDDFPDAGSVGVFEVESATVIRAWRENDEIVASAAGTSLLNLTRGQEAEASLLGERSSTSRLQNLAIDGSTVSLADATLWQVATGDRDTARTWQITDDILVLRAARSGDPQILVNITRCTLIQAERV